LWGLVYIHIVDIPKTTKQLKDECPDYKTIFFCFLCRFADDNKFPAKQSVTQFEIAGERTIHKASAHVGTYSYSLLNYCTFFDMYSMLVNSRFSTHELILGLTYLYMIPEEY
jgi:hypothetical protein